MSDQNTIRILELDGGGSRGYLPLMFFKKFVEQWGVSPNNLASQFDVICGTSVGGIMALYLATGKSIESAEPFFTEKAPHIFSTVPVFAHRATILEKFAFIVADTSIYHSSLDSYGHRLLYKTIDEEFGATTTMQSLKTNVVIPIYENDTDTYKLFSNANYPEFSGQDELIRNVAIGTGSAPIYLPELSFGGHKYIDGGVYQNNPARFGLSLAKALKPTARRACVLSLGTGLGKKGFQPVPTELDNLSQEDNEKLKAYEGLGTLMKLIGVGLTGGQESISKSLEIESKYTLDQLYYYRFQPKLDSNKVTELDAANAEIFAYYKALSEETFNNDIVRISTFIGHLTA